MEKAPQGGADDCPPAALGHRAIRFHRTSGPASKHASPAQRVERAQEGGPRPFLRLVTPPPVLDLLPLLGSEGGR